jgi:hypothetical protein
MDYTIQDSWVEIWRGRSLDGSQSLGGSPLLSSLLFFLFVLKLIAKELCISLQDLLLESFRPPSRKGIA